MKIFVILNNEEKLNIKVGNAIIGKQKGKQNCLEAFLGEHVSSTFILKSVQKTAAKNLEKRGSIFDGKLPINQPSHISFR